MIYLCEKKPECEYVNDAKGCALKHISKARELLSQKKYEDADVMLDAAEKHLHKI